MINLFNCRICFTALLTFVLFQQETLSFDLECDFANYTMGNNPGLACHVNSLRVTSANETITSVNNQTSSFYRDKNVKFLLIEAQTVNVMPKGIATFFPKLEELEISSSKLKSIKQADLKPFKNLKKVFFFTNNLEILDSDLFLFNPELRVIAFDNNELKFIGKDILKPLEKLIEASFLGRGNSCIFRSAQTPSEIAKLIVELEKNCKLPE